MASHDVLEMTLPGSCLCGAVRISLKDPIPLVDMCHCAMCRRWGGMAFPGIRATSADVAGEDQVTIFKSSEWAERAFCSRCGSNLWYRFLPTGHRSFLAGLFDLPPEFEIEQQIFIDEKPRWYDIAQDTPKKSGAEVIAEAKADGFTLS